MPFDGVESPLGYVEKFDQVIDLIEAPNQWIKHTYRSPWGGYCLKEALNMVGVADVFEPLILRTAEDVTERTHCCIESFNDAPQTTHADVITVLHRVRDDLISGKAQLPPRSVAKQSARWSEYKAPANMSWAAACWQKLFCWN